MPSAVASRAFPAWVAFCTAVTVAVATGVTVDDSVPARVAAGFAGLAAGVALSFALASVLPAGRERAAAPAPVPAPAEAWPSAEAPTVVEKIDDRRGRLEQHLATADPEGDVEGWIARAHAVVAETVPGASGYFAALGARAFPDERTRLETYVGRLQTIARDFI
ncbi:MAG TPA: hypothetical protein VHC01_12020 [Gaiellaceae bacterium]|jgi:hypothetical protein|nr:hypothetical protein [Gaiellaceae bacterium]